MVNLCNVNFRIAMTSRSSSFLDAREKEKEKIGEMERKGKVRDNSSVGHIWMDSRTS